MSEPELWGPRQARSDRPRPAALRVLQALVSAGPGTVSDLTERLGGHPNSVRNQLEHLVATGFAVITLLPAARRGRPSHAYAATLDGRQVAAQDEPLDDQRALIEAIADHLIDDADPPAASTALGRAWGRRLTDADAAGEPDLTAVLARQGFTPARSEAGIVLQTCPLLTAARRRPEVVCGIHQGMLEAVAGRPVALLPFATPIGCLVTDPPSAAAADRSDPTPGHPHRRGTNVGSLPHAGAPDSSR